MAHYAIINQENIVVNVFPGIDETDTSQNWETFYGNFHSQKENENLYCKRTSYNTYNNQHKLNGTPFRKNYAGLGYVYDSTLDAFILPKPFDSWLLNSETFVWEPPVEYPDIEKLIINI